MLFSGYLPILHGSGDACMAQVLLEHTETIPGIIMLYRINGEGVSKSMRTDVMHFAGLGIHQTR